MLSQHGAHHKMGTASNRAWLRRKLTIGLMLFTICDCHDSITVETVFATKRHGFEVIHSQHTMHRPKILEDIACATVGACFVAVVGVTVLARFAQDNVATVLAMFNWLQWDLSTDNTCKIVWNWFEKASCL